MSNIYYRYEAKHPSFTKNEWVGIFQTFNPLERRQWHNLHESNWYYENPNVESKAWFTEHGYAKWKEKMEQMIENFHFGHKKDWEFRLITSDHLDNIVVKGKTQVIQQI